MELSRRDALAALSALGTTAAAGCAVRAPRESEQSVVESYVAVATVVYPSSVSGVGSFVRSFLPARLDRPKHGPAMRETVEELQGVAREWYGEELSALDPATRDSLLREVGADMADEDPDGTLAERVRFYVVNELLLALYSSPTGGELVGIENPQGHPGGTDTYQRGPQ